MKKPINPFEPDGLGRDYQPSIERPLRPTPKPQKIPKEKEESSDLPIFVVIGVLLLVLMALGSAF